MSWRRATTLALVASICAASAAPALAERTTTSPQRVAVTGFQEAGDPDGLITRSEAGLTTVGVDGVGLTPNGGGVDAPDATARHSLGVAHHDGLLAEFLVSNWDNSINDFSPALAHRLLGSSSHIAAVASELADDVQSQGWDGVSIDLESLRAGDAHGLVSFLQALRADLPSPKTISVCISNSITAQEYVDRGYDLPGIAATVDRIILMAYDQHGPWERKPGPVGGLAWQREGLQVMRGEVPDDEIDLGQAGYGYIWRPHGAHTVSDARARHLVAADHATAHFRSGPGEWTARLSDGSTIWWADARSFRLRLAIARTDHLHGMAVWDLGLSDPITQ